MTCSTKSFGPGVNGPLLVAVTLGSPAKAPAGSAATSGAPPSSGQSAQSQSASQSQSDPRAGDPRLATLQKDISQTAGVAAVTPVQIDKAGTTAYFNAISTKGPAEEATTELVETLRSKRDPEARRRAPT